MEKAYRPQKTEDKIYRLWEKGGYFTPKINPSKKPFTILLPLPNANDPLHMGHVLFTIQDILIRYQRMLGRPTLWLPGGDHAGIETQFVFEKKLGKEGKSRFDFDRETLYQMITKFVEKNKDINKKQLKKLGFSLDWTRYHYSLEPGIQKTVFETFQKLHRDGLIYRGERIVNFCPQCGTAFSNLEVRYKEEKDSLYFLDYGSVQISTTRPETIFADVGVAVNPQDKRYQKLIGQKATVPLINKKVPIIGDKQVEAKFGTGALKITPGHDPVDFEIGQKHHLKLIKVIDRHGKMINLPNKYQGLRVDKARKAVLADLKKEGKLIKTKSLVHSIGFCYRCGTKIEPLTMPQWFVKMKPLAKPAIEAVKKGQTKIVPKKRFEKMYFDWLEEIQDWNISRQIVWGPRIPAW
ncbi:MAG TPA: class I tRNA ligase family protein, partial [Candidatus Bathyarchaeia archaeon]|nr:class I tRNA ligase family protein [Candidatus Bathyarchaeia archaeon]